MKCIFVLKKYARFFSVGFVLISFIFSNHEVKANDSESFGGSEFVSATRAQKNINKKKNKKKRRKSRRQATEAGYCVECNSYNKTPKNVYDISNLRDSLVNLSLSNVPAAMATDMKNGLWARFPEVMKYSDSRQVSETINFALENRRRRKAGKCYKYVKDALLAGNLVIERPPSIYGKYAADDLKQQGFVDMMEDHRYRDLIKSPKDAPKGAILVYREKGSPKAAGHVEQKTDWDVSGGYVSDFLHEYHDGMSNYELTAVMIKENM